jgi:hypothetical protein
MTIKNLHKVGFLILKVFIIYEGYS